MQPGSPVGTPAHLCTTSDVYSMCVKSRGGTKERREHHRGGLPSGRLAPTEWQIRAVATQHV